MLETLGVDLAKVNSLTRETSSFSSSAGKSLISYALGVSLLSPEEIGDLVKGWRKEARLSQDALEAATGVGQKTLSLMEQGKSLTLENVWAVLRYFQKGPEALTKTVPRNAPEAPRAHSEGLGVAIPLSLHLATLQALERALCRLHELESQAGAGSGASLTREDLEAIGRKAQEEARKLPPPAPREQSSRDSGDSTPPPSGHTRGRRGRP